MAATATPARRTRRSDAAAESMQQQSAQAQAQANWRVRALLASKPSPLAPVWSHAGRVIYLATGGRVVHVYANESGSFLCALTLPSSAQRVTALSVFADRQLVVGSADARLRLYSLDHITADDSGVGEDGTSRLIRTLDLLATSRSASTSASSSTAATPSVCAIQVDQARQSLFCALSDGQVLQVAARPATSSSSRQRSNGEDTDGAMNESSEDVRVPAFVRTVGGGRAPKSVGSIQSIHLVFQSTAADEGDAVKPQASFIVARAQFALLVCRLPQSSTTTGEWDTHESADELSACAVHPLGADVIATADVTGRIRLWLGALKHCVSFSSSSAAATQVTTAVLHWHVHPPTGLTFFARGAYLASVGQEAVCVLWQLGATSATTASSTGNVVSSAMIGGAGSGAHKTFVPRLGAPCMSLAKHPKSEDLVVRLADASAVWISNDALTITKSIASVRPPAVIAHHDAAAISVVPPPSSRALRKHREQLVLPSTHPSAIQFLRDVDDDDAEGDDEPVSDELEIAPSANRVSRKEQTDPEITPTVCTHITSVSLSDSSGQSSTKGSKKAQAGTQALTRALMATADQWQRDGFAPERRLRVWRLVFPATDAADSEGVWSLAARVDTPHDAALSALSFAPSSTDDKKGTAAAMLLSAALDGSIKLWVVQSSVAGVNVQCLAALSYKAVVAPIKDVAWSRDASLFAAVHAPSKANADAKNAGGVSLWSTSARRVVRFFAAPPQAVEGLKHVVFAGKEGDVLAASGTNALVVWNLLTFEERAVVELEQGTTATQLLAHENELVLVSSHSTSSGRNVTLVRTLDLATPKAALVTQARLPSATVHSACFTAAGDLAVLSLDGTLVTLSGSAPADRRTRRAIPRDVLEGAGSSKLHTPLWNAVLDARAAQEQDGASHRAALAAANNAASSWVPSSASGGPLDAPAHTLPSARFWWRDALADCVRPMPAELTNDDEMDVRADDDAPQEVRMDIDAPQAATARQPKHIDIADILGALDLGASQAQPSRKPRKSR